MIESRRKGGRKAVAVIKEKYGEDHYKRIGKLGGTPMHNPDSKAGFAHIAPELRREYARKGGMNGRGKTKVRVEE